MTTAKQPQDYKPKTTRPKAKAIAAEAGGKDPFTFEHDGETYTLPPGADAAGKVPGRLIRDAIMGGDDTTEMKLAFATLEAADPDAEVLDALYEKPYIEMFRIIGDWMQAVQGATEGKSSSSST